MRVPTGAFVCRRNGMVFVTGNSGFPKSKSLADAGLDGWGTQLKPAHEPICLARKPFEGTFIENALEHGTGGLNIDASRIATTDSWAGTDDAKGSSPAGFLEALNDQRSGSHELGRFPSNVLLGHLGGCRLVGSKKVKSSGHYPAKRGKGGVSTSGHAGQADLDERHTSGEAVGVWECAAGCPVSKIDEQSGSSHSTIDKNLRTEGTSTWFAGGEHRRVSRGDSGGASRFFYTAKAQTKNRWSYCRRCKLAFRHGADNFEEHTEHRDDVVSHPTQKPIKLMEYLIRLVTQPGGIVVDPFCGTGTTAVAAKRLGHDFITCDLDPDYAKIAEARLAEVSVDAEAATELGTGAFFCPGCRAKGEIRLISREAVDLMRETGRKTTCVKCLKRFTYEELTG